MPGGLPERGEGGRGGGAWAVLELTSSVNFINTFKYFT